MQTLPTIRPRGDSTTALIALIYSLEEELAAEEEKPSRLAPSHAVALRELLPLLDHLGDALEPTLPEHVHERVFAVQHGLRQLLRRHGINPPDPPSGA